MVELAELINEDNKLQDTRRHVLNDNKASAIRQRFEEKFGFLDPNHCLHGAYQKARKRERLPLAPGNVVNVMLNLLEIAGSVEGAIDLAQTGHNLLSGTGRKYPGAFRHISYLAGVLGWRGDPLLIVREVPSLFEASMARRSFLARLALTHGRPPLQGLNTAGIRQVFVNPRLEEHIMALILRREHYAFGQVIRSYRRANEHGMRAPWTNKQEREWLYDQLRHRRNVELIGPEILRAYFRYKRPSEQAIERFPHLQTLLPPGLPQRAGTTPGRARRTS